MRAERLLLVLLLAGCGPARLLTSPEGTGGWSPERRRSELASRATAAVVDLEAREPPRVGFEPLTLDEALRLTAATSRRIAEAEREVAIAGTRVGVARARLLPRVTGSGRYTWNTDPLTNRIDTTLLPLPPGTPPPVVTIREEEYGVVNGTATVPIDVWGEALRGLTAAQAGYRAEAARRWATVLDEQVATVDAYFGLLEAERLRDVGRETLAAQRQQTANAKSRVDAGRLTRNELLVAEVAVQRTEHVLRQLDLRVAEARWRLNRVVGRPVDAPTRVADVTARPAVPPEADALRDAYAHNPVLRALVEEQQRLEDTRTALVRARLPRFEGGGAVDWSSAEIVQPQRVGSAFVGFSVDLGTDLRRENEIAAARIEAERNRLRIERTLRELEESVRGARRAAEERLAALAAAETAVVQAEENLRIRRQQFDVGRATSENVLDAEALVTEQRAILAQALYQAHTRRAELERLIGRAPDAIVPER